MTLDTWVSLAVILTAFAGSYAALTRQLANLRTELKADITDLHADLKADINRLDDRVYSLAAGLRPQIEAARLIELESGRHGLPPTVPLPERTG